MSLFSSKKGSVTKVSNIFTLVQSQNNHRKRRKGELSRHFSLGEMSSHFDLRNIISEISRNSNQKSRCGSPKSPSQTGVWNCRILWERRFWRNYHTSDLVENSQQLFLTT